MEIQTSYMMEAYGTYVPTLTASGGVDVTVIPATSIAKEVEAITNIGKQVSINQTVMFSYSC